MGVIGSVRQNVAEWVLPALPRRVRGRLVPQRHSWSHRDLTPVAKGGQGEVNLLIAPANFASQGFYWARASELLPGVAAQSLAFGHSAGGLVHAPDVTVKRDVGLHSRIWARRQRKQIFKNFTHVIYEAERPIIPALYGGDLLTEVRDLQAHGIKVAMLSHGSDTRTPSEHRQKYLCSPFHADLDGMTAAYEEATAVNRAALAALDVPKYVSTPDLLDYVPGAAWLPTVTDPDRWTSLSPSSLGQRKPVVLHVPSRSALKGTTHIDRAMRRLQDEGLIEYVGAQNIPYDQMPELVQSADVVIDQVSMGLYGVASVEAMLAGRLVVAQAGDSIRDHIRSVTGRELPIVEATPDTTYDVVKDIALNPKAYEGNVVEGRAFAQEVHSAQYAAGVLGDFLRKEK